MLSPKHATIGARLFSNPEHGEHALNIKRLAVLITAGAMALSLAAPVGAASPNGKADSKGHKSDNLPGVLAQKQSGLKEKARDMVLKGQAKAAGPNQVVKVAKGQFVELAFQGEDQIFTLLGEFGDLQANAHPAHPAHGGPPGPLHNQIPEPDRNGVDNTTIWTADFSQSHYQNLLFNKAQNPSMANWYLEQSYGRYSVAGYVGPWVQVPFNANAYGSNYCGSIVCTRDVGRFMQDQGVAWYNAQIAAGQTPAQIDAMLATFDVWDRYDFDHDGNFDEADGYIDHFQSVHAGEGEETGGGAQGTNAIWSHRSYANGGAVGVGPTVDGTPNLANGIRIGNSSKWIGDYTIEPENGGVGVFSHEFGHDLGLPDEYDTGGNTGFGENSTAWWTPWSQGSYGTVTDDLGSAPVDATQWERFLLGWSNYEVAFAGESSSHKLSAGEINTKQAQALFVVLPDKEVVSNVGDPFEGTNFYHSGAGDNLDNTMTKSFALGAGPINLSFKSRFQIEACWDYAYVRVSTNGGTSWTNVATNVSTNVSPNGQNFGEGITGTSGFLPTACDTFPGAPTWIDVSADLSAYANQNIMLQFRYWTDGAVGGSGISIDNINLTGFATDGAESDTGWTFAGFANTTGSTTTAYPNYYLAEYRTYKGYDLALQKGPYNFDDPAGNWVTHFPYQDGLLIWYWDLSQGDNNVSDHPGEGEILPIDASPGIRHWSGLTTDVARPRLQGYDSTFGLGSTDAFTLNSTTLGTLSVPSHAAVRTFNDNLSYWVASDPQDATSDWKAGWNSVNNPHTNTVIKVASVSAQSTFMQVLVNP
jgi:immune inhibitor A